MGYDLRNLREADLSAANLRRAHLGDAILDSATLVETDLTDADLTGCRVCGISAWELKLSKRTKQQNLVITDGIAWPQITADDIEVAQPSERSRHKTKLADRLIPLSYTSTGCSVGIKPRHDAIDPRQRGGSARGAKRGRARARTGWKITQ
jgi:pentapeptide repeat protein